MGEEGLPIMQLEEGSARSDNCSGGGISTKKPTFFGPRAKTSLRKGNPKTRSEKPTYAAKEYTQLQFQKLELLHVGGICPYSTFVPPLPLLLKVKTVKERQKTEKQPTSTVRPASSTVLCTDDWKPRWHPPSKKMLHEKTHDKRARQQRSRGTCGAEGRGAWHSAPALNWWEEEDGDDGKTDALPSALGENNSTLRTTRATRVPKCVFPAL